MAPSSHPRSRAPVSCDYCGAPMCHAYGMPHPEKPGELHVYECTACRLPMVRYHPRQEGSRDDASPHVKRR